MAAPIPLRDDFDGPTLRCLAKASDDANQTRRLLALAVIYDGSPRGEAARVGGVGRQIIRDWVLRFNAEGPSGLIDRKAPGPAPRLKAEHRQALAAMVDSGPIPAVHGVVRWRLKDLAHWVFTECGIALDETTIGRAVRALGYRKISARPRHPAQHALAIADFKKTFSAAAPSSGPAPPLRCGGRMKRGLVRRTS